MVKVKQRIWRAINPFFLSHRVNFTADHFAYDNVIWNKTDSLVASLNVQEFYGNVLQNFDNFSKGYDFDMSIFDILNTAGSILGSQVRSIKSFSLYTPWGAQSPNGQKLKDKLEKWQKKLCQAIVSEQDSRSLQWQLLLELENMMPWESYNSFLCKLVWNIIRCKLNMPLAMVPFSQKKPFYSALLYSSSPFLPRS